MYSHVIHGYTWQYMAIHGYTRQYKAILWNTWLYMATHVLSCTFYLLLWYTLISLLKVPTRHWVRHWRKGSRPLGTRMRITREWKSAQTQYSDSWLNIYWMVFIAYVWQRKQAIHVEEYLRRQGSIEEYLWQLQKTVKGYYESSAYLAGILYTLY